MKNKIILKFIVSICILSCVFMNCSKIYATSIIEDVFRMGDEFIDEGRITNNPFKDASMLAILSSSLFYAFYYFGMGISGLVAIMMGLIISFSSIEKKASYKEKLMPYLIGCIIIFGSTTIWRIAVGIVSTSL